jgi:RNA polymerase sigma-70 factor (ECF subfamily)
MVEGQQDAAAVERLIVLAAGGDAAAFTALYDHFGPRLRRFLRHEVADAGRVEDLVQQVFVKMIEALPRYRHTGAPFGAWVFRVARNLVIDERRTRHPSAPIEVAGDRAAVDGDPVDSAIRADERARLVRAIDALPADQRDVLVWRFLADLSPSETAVLMSRSPEAVRALQHRALLALRTRLGTSLSAEAAAS